MKKRILAFLLAMALCVLTIPTVGLAETTQTPAPNYLTITAMEDGATVTFKYSEGTAQYKVKGAADWTNCKSAKNATGDVITLAKAGDYVQFKGNGVKTSDAYHFAFTKKVAASGSVTSLTDGNGGDPNVTLSQDCYSFMFKQCTTLISPPELPAVSLANASKCYFGMFEECTALSFAPELPATTLSVQCYYIMFKKCTKLNSLPQLNATTLANDCYGYMFEGCTGIKLTTAGTSGISWKLSNVPAEQKDTYCKYMFSGGIGTPNPGTTYYYEKPVPTTDFFDFNLPDSLTYDGTAKEVTVTAKKGISGMGQVTVYYYSGDTKLSSAPKEAGTYTVKISLAEGDNFKASTAELTDSTWKYTVNKKQLTVADTKVESKEYDGTTDAKIKLGKVDGIVSDDDVTVVAEGAFDDKNVGDAINVPVTYSLKGAKKDNYIAPVDETVQSKITKAKVVMVSASAEKTYDGKALSKEKVTSNGFVKGEGATYAFTGEQVDPGISTNTFTYKLNAGTEAGNYNIVKEYGILSVTAPKKEDISVDNSCLEEILEGYLAKDAYKGKQLSVELKMEEEISAADEKLIQEKAGNRKLLVVNAKLVLLVDGKETNIGDDNEVLVATTYKFDFKKGTDVQVLRVHDNKVDELKEEKNSLGEYIVINKEEGTVTVVASKYSAYALTYTEVIVPTTGDSNHFMLYALIGLFALAACISGVICIKKARR